MSRWRALMMIGGVCAALLPASVSADATGRRGQWPNWRLDPDYQATPSTPAPAQVVSSGGVDLWEVAKGEWVQLRRAWHHTLGPVLLPSRSIGDPNYGAQANAVWLHDRPGLYVRSRYAWGTRETVQAIDRAADEMMALYPSADELVVTEISKYNGGKVKPHMSHRTGRDVDLLLYFKPAPEGKRGPMEPEKTWALMEALMRGDQIEVGILDYNQQKVLYRYARDVLQYSEDALRPILAYPHGRRHRDSIWVHAPGHRTHLHVRFKSPRALEAADHYDVAQGFLRYLYTTEEGDTQRSVARAFGTTVKILAETNGWEADARAALPKWRRIWVKVPVTEASTPCFEYDRAHWVVSEAAESSLAGHDM